MVWSIFFPLLLSTFRLFRQNPEAIFGSGFLGMCVMIVAAPFYPVLLHMRELMLVQACKANQVSIQALEFAKYHVSRFIQVSVGLESHMGIIISTLLILLTNSHTRTIVGLEPLFDQETLFYFSPNLTLALSISLSLYSCIHSHIKGITKRREWSTTKSTVTILSYTTVSIITRVFVCVLFWTPGLGLFESLRHLQGEMYPYKKPFLEANVTQDLFHFGNAPLIPWSKITRWNYTGYQQADPPELSLYTYFTIEEYFLIFSITMVFNAMCQVAVKKLFNPDVFKALSKLDVMIHGISCCFIPSPMQEWDGEKGTVDMHIIRMKLVFREMMASIILNFTFHLLLVSPLIILGNLLQLH